MDHHNNIGSALQSFAVAVFLVAAVTEIFFMDEDRQFHFFGNFNRPVMAAIINHQPLLYFFFRDGLVGFFKGSLGVISRHNDHYPGTFFYLFHFRESSSNSSSSAVSIFFSSRYSLSIFTESMP